MWLLRAHIGKFSDYSPRQFPEATQAIRMAHLLGGPAIRLEDPRRRDQDAATSRAARRDVQSIRVVEKAHAPRRVLRAGARRRVDHYRRLLALEPVNRAYANTLGQTLRQRGYLRVVGSHDEDVASVERALVSVTVDPDYPAGEQALDDSSHRIDLLGRAARVAPVLDGDVEQPTPGKRGVPHEGLALETGKRIETLWVPNTPSPFNSCS